jgi:hypothetical protein
MDPVWGGRTGIRTHTLGRGSLYLSPTIWDWMFTGQFPIPMILNLVWVAQIVVLICQGTGSSPSRSCSVPVLTLQESGELIPSLRDRIQTVFISTHTRDTLTDIIARIFDKIVRVQ